MKRILKSKRAIVTLLSLVAVIIGSNVLATMALLSKETGTLENTFELGNVTTKVEETFEPTDVATVFRKEPVVVNTGANDCYVRMRVNASPEEQLEITGWDSNWTYNTNDGFYYYIPVLKVGERTTPLFTTVSVKEEYISTIEGFEVTVYQEAVQATLNARDGSTTADAATIWAVYDGMEVPAAVQ